MKKILLMMVLLQAWLLVAFNKVYFTPRDDLKAQLIQLIQEEKLSIHAAVYMLTDKAIAQALIDAHVRGVKVFLILDQISMGEKYGKGLWLQAQGISICVHAGQVYKYFFMPIMHHKFFIFGFNNRLRTSLVWTGSYNCTASASRLHDENVLLTDDATTVSEFKKCFNALAERLHAHRFFQQEATV